MKHGSLVRMSPTNILTNFIEKLYSFEYHRQATGIIMAGYFISHLFIIGSVHLQGHQ